MLPWENARRNTRVLPAMNFHNLLAIGGALCATTNCESRCELQIFVETHSRLKPLPPLSRIELSKFIAGQDTR